jgi:hypothetical protein
MRTIYLLGILVLLALFVPATSVHAGGVVTVCDEAHLLAALAGGGTVTFACSGTITLTAEIVIAADTTIDGGGQNVTISGNNAVRVFTVNSGVAFNPNELTVANGSAGYGADGGGIWNGGTLTVSNCTFTDNSANMGGGIYNIYGGTATVSNSTFIGNRATNDWTGSGGGGIYNFGALSVSNSTFADNYGGYDGGGGIHAVNALTVRNSTFAGNSAGTGGGIYLYDGTFVVSNSTFSGNSGGSGGGIANVGYGTAMVINGTFSGNSGGIYTNDCFYSTTTLKNTIVANNEAGGNCTGAVIDGGGNLSYPDTTCPGINADPVLGPLQNNGGPTETMDLGSGSAAIDTGIDAICAAAPVNNRDQRGMVRPLGRHCDIGAVERTLPFWKWFPSASAR